MRTCEAGWTLRVERWIWGQLVHQNRMKKNENGEQMNQENVRVKLKLTGLAFWLGVILKVKGSVSQLTDELSLRKYIQSK